LQNAKDTFYQMLRGRLAALNPDRNIPLRGVTRPGVLVEENELTTAFHLPDCFRLQWLGLSADTDSAMPLIAAECVIDYETAGTAINGGMDRGRSLAAMDEELLAALNAWPHNTTKNNYVPLVSGKPVVAMNTKVWWAEPKFGPVEVKQNRLARTAKVTVMSYQEAGEL
jgi:hypothetical protein